MPAGGQRSTPGRSPTSSVCPTNLQTPSVCPTNQQPPLAVTSSPERRPSPSPRRRFKVRRTRAGRQSHQTRESSKKSSSCQTICFPCRNLTPVATKDKKAAMNSPSPKSFSPFAAFNTKSQHQMSPLQAYPVCEISVTASLSCPDISPTFGTAASIAKEKLCLKKASLQSLISTSSVAKSFSAVFLSSSKISRKRDGLFRRASPFISETCFTLRNKSASYKKSRRRGTLSHKKQRKVVSSSTSRQSSANDLQLSSSAKNLFQNRNKPAPSRKSLVVKRKTHSSNNKPCQSNRNRNQTTGEESSQNLCNVTSSTNKKIKYQQEQITCQEKGSCNITSSIKKVSSHSLRIGSQVIKDKTMQKSGKKLSKQLSTRPRDFQESLNNKTKTDASLPKSKKPLTQQPNVSTAVKKKKSLQKDVSLSSKANELSMKPPGSSKTTSIKDQAPPKSIGISKTSHKKTQPRPSKTLDISTKASLSAQKESSEDSKISSQKSLSKKLQIQNKCPKTQKVSETSQNVSLLAQKPPTPPYKAAQAPAPRSPPPVKPFFRKATSMQTKTPTFSQKPSPPSCITNAPSLSPFAEDEDNSELAKIFSQSKNESLPSTPSPLYTVKMPWVPSKVSLDTGSQSPKSASESLYTSSSASLFQPGSRNNGLMTKSNSISTQSGAPKRISSISQGLIASLEGILATSEDVMTSHEQIIYHSAISSSGSEDNYRRVGKSRQRGKSVSPTRSIRIPITRETSSCKASPLGCKRDFSPYGKTHLLCRNRSFSPRTRMSQSSWLGNLPPKCRNGKEKNTKSFLSSWASWPQAWKVTMLHSFFLVLSFVISITFLIKMSDAFAVISWLLNSKTT